MWNRRRRRRWGNLRNRLDSGVFWSFWPGWVRSKAGSRQPSLARPATRVRQAAHVWQAQQAAQAHASQASRATRKLAHWSSLATMKGGS
eukprot:gene8261-biopygen7608